MILDDSYGYDHSTVTGQTDLTDPDLKSMKRIRFLRDGNRLEFSYAIGTLSDGTDVYVSIHTLQFSTLKRVKLDVLEAFKADSRYAKGMGAFNDGVISIY